MTKQTTRQDRSAATPVMFRPVDDVVMQTRSMFMCMEAMNRGNGLSRETVYKATRMLVQNAGNAVIRERALDMYEDLLSWQAADGGVPEGGEGSAA